MGFGLSPEFEKYRIREGRFASATGDRDGALEKLPSPFEPAVTMVVIFSPGDKQLRVEWEHVSVSTATRCPTWAEMEWIKRQFWTHDCAVAQYHVPTSMHMNLHEFCLHLWRPWSGLALPPVIAV